MGSNGLTSARHDVFAKYLAEKYPETYDKSVPEELVYSGSYRLTTRWRVPRSMPESSSYPPPVRTPRW